MAAMHPVVRGALTAAALVALGAAAPAHAQCCRGGCGGGISAAEMSAMQAMERQMIAYQQDVQRYQTEMAGKYAEIAKQYDADGDGKLRGAEQSKFNKYMFEVQKGRKPNPFADIRPPGQGLAATASGR